MYNRPLKNIVGAFVKKQFYIAFVNILKNFDQPVEILKRYIFRVGEYPKKFHIKTPVSKHTACLYSSDDMMTLVECFGKLDYPAWNSISCVVDFGSNIGISAGYFLTRNENAKAYLFEPLLENIEKLKLNLKEFESRYELKEVAIGLENGHADFGFETTGRYGGLESSLPETIRVQVQKANEVISSILEREGCIDILKIDVEGLETAIIKSLSPENLKKINRIYAETIYLEDLPGFSKIQYGEVVQFSRN
jgi:FkbM family methyltransferase